MGKIVDVGANPKAGFGTGFEFAGLLIVAGGLAAMLLIDPEGRSRALQRRDALPKEPALGRRAPATAVESFRKGTAHHGDETTLETPIWR